MASGCDERTTVLLQPLCQPHLVRALTAAVATALIAAATLSACSPPPRPAPVAVADLIGEPLTAAVDALPARVTLFIQDVSPLVGLKSTYRDGSDAQRWTIVAACADVDDVKNASSVEVAVVPLPSDQVRDATSVTDPFDRAVDCEGRPHTARMLASG